MQTRTLRMPSVRENTEHSVQAPKIHMCVHSGERPFKCDICEMGFTSKGNVVVHTRFHTGEKPFKCESCGKSFHLKDFLNDHLRTHTGERPHKCDQCGAGFSQTSGLSSHKRIHTGDLKKVSMRESISTCGIFRKLFDGHVRSLGPGNHSAKTASAGSATGT